MASDVAAVLPAGDYEPDFYIGAHAAVAGHQLLTRDVRRYRTYLPTVRLIAPIPVDEEVERA